METISFTIPDRPAALRACADMLNRMADVYDPAPTIEQAAIVSIGLSGSTVTTPEKIFEQNVAPAPVAETSVTTTTASAPGRDVDSAGLPWDERIHSGGKSTIGDGTWKLKRGADPELVKQIRGANGVNAAMQADGPDLPPPPVDNGAIVADFVNKTVTAIGAQFITTAQVTTALSAHGVEGGAVGLATHADAARIGAAVLAELGITDAPTV